MIESGPGYEVWLGEAIAGCRTSCHSHPFHRQNLTVLRGRVEVHQSGGTSTLCRSESCNVSSETRHELRFPEDTSFIEVYVARPQNDLASVEATKVVHFA